MDGEEGAPAGREEGAIVPRGHDTWTLFFWL